MAEHTGYPLARETITTGVNTKEEDKPLVAPDDIWIIFRLF